MNAAQSLAQELKNYKCISYYPASGTDLSDLDYFGSGKKPWSERILGGKALTEGLTDDNDPDLFIHTDINFYQEFEAGTDLEADEYGFHGEFEVLEFRELPTINEPNKICDNYDFSGKCFEYKLRLWGSDKVKTLIFCLCENEYLVSEILLKNNINLTYIWSRDWAGGMTCGTWLVNVLNRLNSRKIYTDRLCVPGKKGEPRNQLVEEKYPELMAEAKVKLVRNPDSHWIVEGGHGWIDEFYVVSKI